MFFKVSMECKRIDSVNEGVEFSVRLSSMPNEWIPLKYIYYSKDNRNSKFTNYYIRGYVVKTTVLKRRDQSSTKSISVSICDLNVTDSIQFRWLQTSQSNVSSSRRGSLRGSRRDIWVINNVTITFNGTTLLQDNFSSSVLK